MNLTPEQLTEHKAEALRRAIADESSPTERERRAAWNQEHGSGPLRDLRSQAVADAGLFASLGVPADQVIHAVNEAERVRETAEHKRRLLDLKAYSAPGALEHFQAELVGSIAQRYAARNPEAGMTPDSANALLADPAASPERKREAAQFLRETNPQARAFLDRR